MEWNRILKFHRINFFCFGKGVRGDQGMVLTNFEGCVWGWSCIEKVLWLEITMNNPIFMEVLIGNRMK